MVHLVPTQAGVPIANKASVNTGNAPLINSFCNQPASANAVLSEYAQCRRRNQWRSTLVAGNNSTPTRTCDRYNMYIALASNISERVYVNWSCQLGGIWGRIDDGLICVKIIETA